MTRSRILRWVTELNPAFRLATGERKWKNIYPRVGIKPTTKFLSASQGPLWWMLIRVYGLLLLATPAEVYPCMQRGMKYNYFRGNPPLFGFAGTSFNAPRTCGRAYPRQCFQVRTTSVPSKSASISTLSAGNAPVVPLVLHGVVGDGNHLPSGDSNARLPCPFP